MGKKRDYGGSEDSPDACFGGLGKTERERLHSALTFVKEPTQEMTQPNKSGRNQATENAAMPPELPPRVHRRAGSGVMFQRSSTMGSTSVSRKVALTSETVSYSLERCSGCSSSLWPGVMPTTIVTGISPRLGAQVDQAGVSCPRKGSGRRHPYLIKLSMRMPSATAPPPSKHSRRLAGVSSLYCAGT